MREALSTAAGDERQPSGGPPMSGGFDFDLLVLGDCNPDLVLRGPDLRPRFGQAERLVEEARLVVGGSGAILACGAARLGLRTALAGMVGDDLFGRFMLDALRQRGVDVRGCVVRGGLRSGVTVVLSQPGDRAMLTDLGAIGALTCADVDLALLRAARHVHVSAYFLQRALAPGLPGLFRQVHAAGGTTSIDPNWDPTERWDGGLHALLEQTDVLLPNGTEARRLAPAAPDLESAVVALAATGPLVVAKLGAEGAVACDSDGRLLHVPGLRVVSEDTTGAGDSFDAGFLAAWLWGWPLERALALACACGALSTRATGGTAAQPTLAEATRLLDGPA
jgi:sugar/nucleoside kinase (ribokinase family)